MGEGLKSYFFAVTSMTRVSCAAHTPLASKMPATTNITATNVDFTAKLLSGLLGLE
jgi:hypothetical protein